MGCLYNLSRVGDMNFETSCLEFFPVDNEFFEVFLDDQPGIPLEKEIDFCIDLLPYM